MTPVVLVHGFLGGGRQWADQRSVFDKPCDVVTVDLPGFGDNSDILAPDSIVGFAEFVLDKLADAGIERFHLLGHSMGGMIVQEMIALAPTRIDKLVLYATSALGSMPNRFETIETSKRRAEVDGPRTTARRIAATWFAKGDKSSAFGICAEIAQRASLQAINAGLDAMATWSRVDELKQISSPTLVVWGDQDKSYGWPQIEELWRTIPVCQLAVVPDCAHAVHLEKPELFNLIVRDFLCD